MNSIKVQAVKSGEIYQKISMAEPEKKDDLYRYELMKPFEGKWEKYHCPLKASKEGGYDVVMASKMLGLLSPQEINENSREWIEKLQNADVWESCTRSIQESFQCFIQAGIDLPVKECLYTLLLGNPESPYLKLSDDYCGDGGIPGYIFGMLVPSEETIAKMPAALAHEVNHNVRFQFIKWSNDITLGEYIVCEGLAERFAAYRYGEKQIGPWVKKTDADTLNDYIKPLIKEALLVHGFDNITAYMYGDEMAALQQFIPAGMPYCAGYACGYWLVDYFLKETGTDIIEATILPAEKILEEASGFWEEKTIF